MTCRDPGRMQGNGLDIIASLSRGRAHMAGSRSSWHDYTSHVTFRQVVWPSALRSQEKEARSLEFVKLQLPVQSAFADSQARRGLSPVAVHGRQRCGDQGLLGALQIAAVRHWMFLPLGKP